MRIVLIALLLAACTTIDMSRVPPSDWPKLRVEIVHTSQNGARTMCPGAAFDTVHACTVANFDAGTCNIYTSTDNPAVLDHEKMHCLGYDHPGDSAMRRAWADWKALHP